MPSSPGRSLNEGAGAQAGCRGGTLPSTGLSAPQCRRSAGAVAQARGADQLRRGLSAARPFSTFTGGTTKGSFQADDVVFNFRGDAKSQPHVQANVE
jgi:hypothetical protein